jgi:hypothetical protein
MHLHLDMREAVQLARILSAYWQRRVYRELDQSAADLFRRIIATMNTEAHR